MILRVSLARAAALALVAGAASCIAATAWAHDDVAPTIERLRARPAPEIGSPAGRPAARADALLDVGELERLEGQFAEAETYYARAQALDPLSPRLALCRAALAADRLDWDAADSLVAIALARGAAGPEPHRLRAHVHREAGRTRDAVADLDQALAEPRGWNPDVVVTRARWTRELDGRAAEHAFLVQALARDPESIPIALVTIDGEAELGEFAPALARLERVIARCPGRCHALRARRAEFLSRLGRTLEADAERSAILDEIAALEAVRPADLALASALRAALGEQP